MVHILCQRAFNAARDFLRNQSGSILIYTGAFMSIGVGGAALSIDIGRVVLLKTQMQNRADAGALAGAAQLDAQKGAIARSEAVMKDAMVAYTTAAADSGELAVWSVAFYKPAEDYITRGAVTDVDVEARFAEVNMARRTLSFFYAPAMNLMTGNNASSYTELGSRAVAMSDPFICKVQPMMICNPVEAAGEIPDDTYAGYSITLKQGTQGGGTWVAGNFGLLDLPSDGTYSGGGAMAVYQALSAVEPSGCYGYNIVTAPGSMTFKVSDGINTRFGQPETDPTIIPAPNVMAYPLDDIMREDKPAVYDSTKIIGDGGWDLDAYWALNHTDDTTGDPIPMPGDLVGATRFQVYLFEQGQYYWKKNGKNVLVTELDQVSKGYTKVDPADYPLAAVIPSNPDAPDDVWTDGEPPGGQTVSPADPDSTVPGYDRRILRVNILNCIAEDVKGSGDYGSGGNFMEIFLTEPADGPSGGAGIYGEFIRKLDPIISLEFHGNVRLTE